MRPLRLEIQAFGPFATREVIDFTQLADNALFLIHGKTGSGKTTVLDAMCYALYGKTSGDERDGTDMRSHHADDALVTELSFDFALGEERYRIKRVPKQTRPKVRGEGVTTQPAEAEFYRLDASGLETEALATGPSKVAVAVLDRLHFDAEQFRQVVVLPQGRFRDLLSARSDDRQKILEALFQTGRYRRIERALKDKARAIKKQVEALTLEIDLHADEAARLLRLEDDAARTDSALTAAWTALDLRLQHARERETLARKQESAARTALERGTQKQQRLVALKQARTALQALEKQAEQIGAMRAALDLARRAAPLGETMASVDRTRRRAEAAAEQAAVAAESAQAVAARARETAAALAAESTPAAEAARADANKNVLRLESLQQTVALLAEATTALRQAESAASSRGATAASAAETLREAEAAATAAAQRRNDQRTLAAPHAQLTEAALSSKSRRERHDQWIQARSRAEETAHQSDEQTAALAAADKALADVHASLSAARDQRHEARAALLAKGLAHDAPCPVCGATDHPSPARSAVEPPNDTHVDALEAAVSVRTQERDAAQARVTASGRMAAEARSAVSGFERELGEAAHQSREQLQAAWRAAEASARQAAQAHAGLGARAAVERQALADKDAAETTATQARKDAEQALLAKEGAAAEVRTRAQDVPDALQSPAALTSALQTARATATGLEKAHHDAREAEATLAKQAAVDAKAAQAAQASATQRHREHAEQAMAWQTALTQAGFSDTQAWQAARLPEADTKDVRARIATYEQALSAAKDRAQRATAEAGDTPAPDLEVLRSASEAAEIAVRQLAEDVAGIERNVKDALRLRKKIAAQRALCQSLEERYGIVGRLAQVADGANAQRLSFQRFVLASRLDEVLDVASQRLVAMTAGRYRLRRREVVDSKRRAGGLEIDVDDNETGKVRAARTLSGGEGFLAALALSLATADVVTGHAGGIRLDAIFVDEGFGSLDDEALDRALGTLLSLHEEGRLVGVISHVSELRERIPVRLEVTRGEAGSHTRFVLP